MKQNNIILLVLVILGILFCVGVKRYLQEPVPTTTSYYPSSSWRGGAVSGTHSSTSAGGSLLLTQRVSPSISVGTHSYRKHVGTHSSPSAAYNTQSPTRSIQRGAYNTQLSTRSLQSSATMHSYGGGGITSSDYSIGDYSALGMQSASPAAGFSLPGLLYTSTNMQSQNMLALGQTSEYQANIPNTAYSAAPARQTGKKSQSSSRKMPGMYQAWMQKYYDYYGYYPASTEDLQEFIDWWLGQGLYAPEPIPDSSGPSSIYASWLDKFYDQYGRYPNDTEELEEFIRWCQGEGIYTDNGVPLGDGLWILMLLAALFTLTNVLFKRKTTRSNQH